MNTYLLNYKPQKFNRTSINYLYEVSAIPELVRSEYLVKLLKRKNAENQKNVRLIKIIYDYIDKDNIILWDADRICNELEITYNMLRYHKSRFLKGLREYYFNWKVVSKELELTGEKDQMTNEFVRAKKMFEIGMRREAKIILLRLDKRIKHKKLSRETLSMRSEIYELLLDYYFHSKNIVRYNKFLTNLKTLHRKIKQKKIRLRQKERSLLRASLFKAKANKHDFNIINDSSYQGRLDNYLSALKESEAANNTAYQLAPLFSIGTIEITLGNVSKGIKTLKKGYALAKKNKLLLPLYAFKSEIAFQKFRLENHKDPACLSVIEKSYNEAKKLFHCSQWFKVVLLNYYKVLIYFDNNRIPEVQKEMVNHFFLYGSTSQALLELYKLNIGTSNFIEWEISKVRTEIVHT